MSRTNVIELTSDERIIDAVEGSTAGTENITVRQTWSGHPEDPTRTQWMRLAETSPALGFWNRPEEDVYTDNDGEPI
jgi:hypothetical protein